jgi:peptide/nickel transport system substrate-binding protein
MVYDYPCGPQWMIYEPLLDTFYADTSDLTFGTKIDNAVQRNDTHVWLNVANKDLAKNDFISFTPISLFDLVTGRQHANFWDEVAGKPIGYSPRIFFQVISQCWASIMSKRWLLEYVSPLARTAGHPTGEWPKTWENWTFYCYPTSPLQPQTPCVDIIPQYPGGDYGVTCGTGPYILDRFNALTEWSLVKFDDYWGGWPANWPNLHNCKPAGWVKRLTVRQRDLSTCISELINGDCDFASHITSSRWSSFHVNEDIWEETLDGIRLQYWKAPGLSVQWFLFTFDIAPSEIYGRIYGYGVLSEDGIPRDFFKDVHVRKAFAYCINFTYLINDLLKGIGYQQTTFAPSGLPYVNPEQDYYSLNIEKAKEEFALAWNGQLLNTGFSITLTYWGTLNRDICQNIAWYITNIGNEIAGGKFHVQLMAVLPWSQIIRAIQRHELPTFMLGWSADYLDVHNFAYPVLYSGAETLVSYQNYKNQTINELIENGAHLPDGPLRQAIYYQLESLYYEDVPSVPLYATVTRCYMRDWVYGYYYNALYPGIFAYNIWKWDYLKGDINYDGKVDIKDISSAAQSFGATYGLSMHARWNFYCDVDDIPKYRWRDQKIDIRDIYLIAKDFGKIGTPWQPPP